MVKLVKQYVFLFICAFLTTALGNDSKTQKNHHDNQPLNPHLKNLNHHSNNHYLANRKEVNHQAHNRHQSHHLNSVLHHNFYQNRHGSNQQCGWVCPSHPDTSGFELYFNQTTNFVAIVNVTAEFAIVFDVSSGSIVLFNGQKGLTIVIDIKTQTVIEISYSVHTSSIVWLGSKQSFQTFFEKLVSFKEIIQICHKNGGKTSTLSNPNDQVLNEIIIIISQLGINVEFNNNGSVVLNLLIRISKIFVKIYSSPLRQLIIKITHIHITFGVQRLSEIFEGILDLINSIQGGPQIFINSTITFDIRLIFTSNSGLELFIKILSEIGNHLDLSEVLGNALNNPERLLKIIVKLGGNNTIGLEGFFNVLYNIIGVVNNHIPVQNLINILIEVAWHRGLSLDPSSLSRFIHLFLQTIHSQNSHYHNTSRLHGLIKFLEGLLNNSLQIGGLDCSSIIKDLLQEHFQNPIEFIVRILVQIGRIINPAKIISQFFTTIIGLLNNTQGVEIVSQLLPGLNLSQIIGSGDLQSLLNGTEITKLLNGTNDISSVFSQIPIIGNIYNSIAQLIHTTSHGSLNLQNLLNSSSILNNIEGLLESGGGNPISNTIGEIGGIINHIISGIGGMFGWDESGGGNGGSSNGGNGGSSQGGTGGSSIGGTNSSSVGGNGGSSIGGNGGLSVGGNGDISGTNDDYSNNNGNTEVTPGWSWSSNDRKIYSQNKHKSVHSHANEVNKARQQGHPNVHKNINS